MTEQYYNISVSILKMIIIDILDVFDEKIVANNDLKEYENMDNFSDLLVSFGLFEQFVNKNGNKTR